MQSILVIRHSLAGLKSEMIQIKRTRPLKRKKTDKERKKKLTRIEMNESYEFINNQNVQKYSNFYQSEASSMRTQEQIQNHDEDALFEE